MLSLPKIIATGNCPICCKALPTGFWQRSNGWYTIDCQCDTNIEVRPDYGEYCRAAYNFEVNGVKYYLIYNLSNCEKFFYLGDGEDIVTLRNDLVPTWNNLEELKQLCKKYIDLQIFT